MRVAIAGAGNVGLFIANDLVRSGPRGALIEQNPRVVERRRAPPTASSGSSPTRARCTSLREAGLERCDVVVAATGDDEDNLVSRCSPSRSSPCRASSPA